MLSSFEKQVAAIVRDAIHRFPEGQATITGALRKANFPTAVLPSAGEVSKSAGDPTYTRASVESLMAAVDDPLFKGANRYFYAVRDNALPDPKPEPEVEVRKAWSEHTMQQRAELALETLAAERFAKVRYLPDAPSSAQCYLAACESPLGRQLYKAATSRGNITAEEWLAQQDPSPSGELVEVAKLLRSSF